MIQAGTYVAGPVFPAPETYEEAWAWITADAARYDLTLVEGTVSVKIRRDASHGVLGAPQVYLEADIDHG